MSRVVNRNFSPEGWGDGARALVAALEAHGLVARIMSHGTVRVKNPAGEPTEDDRHGQALSPGMGQEVACSHREDGSLWWFWVWSGPTRDAPQELEPLCPLTDAQTAADRIAHVLAVPFAGSSTPSRQDGGM